MEIQIPSEDIELAELQRTKPKKPIIPRLLHNNATAEARDKSLATGWPSGGMISAEAGGILGGHSMRAESIMANLAHLNQRWDGAPISSERITTDNYYASCARFMACLGIQPAGLEDFHADNAELSRGSGFWARFLFCQPETTQGTRFYSEPPENTPALLAYSARIAALLAIDLPRNEAGELNPRMLDLSPEAKRAWIDFHDSVELELCAGGKLADVRDVASKIANNAARLAALFEVFENGHEAESVSADSMRRAIAIVEWHLHEARRFFGELAQPEADAEAVKLEAWILKVCRSEGLTEIAKNRILQAGPSKLRRKANLDSALEYLQALGRVYVAMDEKLSVIKINPDLLEEPKGH